MQTAVEWLVDQLKSTRNKYMGFKNIDIDYQEIIKQAKEMEKKQIIWAHGIQMKGVNNHKCVTGEQYYNETFKTK